MHNACVGTKLIQMQSFLADTNYSRYQYQSVRSVVFATDSMVEFRVTERIRVRKYSLLHT